MKLLLIFAISVLLMLPEAIEAASFRCYGKLTSQERLVCENKALSALDSRLDAIYSLAVLISNPKSTLKSSQREWIKGVRAKCTNVSCLQATYLERINVLMNVVLANATPFPSEVKSEVVSPATSSPYCKSNGSDIGDSFSLSLSVKGQSVSGNIDGFVDCGRKVWGDIDIQGQLLGKFAVVKFQPEFSDTNQGPPAEALIVVVKNQVYWRILSEIEVESYVPRAENMRLKQRNQSGNPDIMQK